MYFCLLGQYQRPGRPLCHLIRARSPIVSIQMEDGHVYSSFWDYYILKFVQYNLLSLDRSAHGFYFESGQPLLAETNPKTASVMMLSFFSKKDDDNLLADSSDSNPHPQNEVLLNNSELVSCLIESIYVATYLNIKPISGSAVIFRKWTTVFASIRMGSFFILLQRSLKVIHVAGAERNEGQRQSSHGGTMKRRAYSSATNVKRR